MGKTTVPAACVKGGMAPFSGRDHSRGFHISDCPMQVWERRYMENNQKNCMSVVAILLHLTDQRYKLRISVTFFSRLHNDSFCVCF